MCGLGVLAPLCLGAEDDGRAIGEGDACLGSKDDDELSRPMGLLEVRWAELQLTLECLRAFDLSLADES